MSVEGKRLMVEKDRVDDQAEEWIYRGACGREGGVLITVGREVIG